MATLATIQKQVIDLLNANSYSAGVKQYSAVSGDEDFLIDAINRAITEAQTIVAERICRADNSTLKSAFVQADQSISHSAQIPTHYGNIFNVKITPYAGASYTLRGQRKSAGEIASTRANPDNLYGTIAHDAQDTVNSSHSTLAGYYSDDDNLFEFTGYSAVISYCDFTNTALTSYPASLEVPITHIAVGLLAKDGTVSDKFNEHFNIGLTALGEIIKDEK